MEVGIALAIPGLLELCLRLGKQMYKRYQAFRDAVPELHKRILALESRWLQIQAQIRYLMHVWNRLPPRLQVHFNNVLSLLHTLLMRGHNMVEGLTVSKGPKLKDSISRLLTAINKEGNLRRGAFALTQKEALDSLIGELRTWHNDMLGPSWFQLLRLPGDVFADVGDDDDREFPQILHLQQLRKHSIETGSSSAQKAVAVPVTQTAAVDRLPIFASPLSLCVLPHQREHAISETVTILPDLDIEKTREAFQRLVEKMGSSAMPAVNLLQCLGIHQHSDSTEAESITLIFKIPPGLSTPRSLREMLMESNVGFPLLHRITIARQLAKSIMSIHSLNLVHKNIRPETILVFSSESEDEVESYILGFEQFRPITQQSVYRGDSDWRKNLYRHPTRQGIRPEAEYIMQHDIYSLGICLLELGLKRSFVVQPGASGRPHPDIEATQYNVKDQDRRALFVKNQMQRLAGTELAAIMGKKYSDAVLSCLSCLDRGGNNSFGEKEELDDPHEILVSVRFMETITMLLQQLNI